MDTIVSLGYTFIQMVQTFRHPALDAFFLFFTFVGSEAFLLVLVPVLMWAYDLRLGLYTALLYILSGFVNLSLKAVFHQPRPSPEVVARLVQAGGYGFPSGHAQNAVVVWGWLAHMTRQRAALWGATVLSLLIGFSRIYLGVHFPHDVLAGWGIGLVLLGVVVHWGPQVERWLTRQPLQAQLTVALLPLLTVIVVPDELVARAAGALVGAAVGTVVERSSVGFVPGGSPFQRLACLTVGFLGLGLVWGGSKAVAPSTLPSLLARYALIGTWITLGAPFAFVRLGLTRSRAGS